MSLFRLPRGKFPLTFLAVPAGKDCRVECPCQTFDGFIGIRGKICGFFLLVQTHTPLIVPLRQRRAGKSGFHFISGARARKLFCHALAFGGFVDGLQVPAVMRSFPLLQWFQKESAPYRLPTRSDSELAAAWHSGELSVFPGQTDNSDCF